MDGSPHTTEGLRHAVRDGERLSAPAYLTKRLTWAADEIDRLNAIIAAESHKTFLIDSDSAQDHRVRARVWGVIAWHVNRHHADLSDRDLALAAFREYEKHWGRALIDPNE